MIDIKIKHPINTVRGKVLLEFNKTFENGTFSCLYGESGAGKTTILRVIAGLIKPEFGYIKVDDELWLDSQKNIFLPPQKRKVGFVFQDYALFPHLSVRENLAFANKDKASIDEFLELMDLKNLAKSYPKELSGGQAQRVALARALIFKPKLLLLDEPLSALDFKMRVFLQDELLRLSKHFHLSTLLVSHDLAEIYKLASRVFEIKEGKCLKDCSPSALFTPGKISAKLQFNATVLEIKKADIMAVLTLLIGKELVKITLTQKELEQKYPKLKLGSSIIIAIKAHEAFIVGLKD